MAEILDYDHFLNIFFNIASRARVGAESVLSKTRYGQGNLISIVDTDDGKFQFKVNATGELRASLDEARRRSDELFLTEFFQLSKQASHGDRLAYLSEIMGSIDRRSRSFGAEEQRILRATGISQDVIDDIMNGRFTSSLVTFRVSEAQRKQGASAQGIAEMLKSGDISGSAIFDDEGARLIQMETHGGVRLNQIQIEALFRLAGHGTVSAEAVFGQGGALAEGSLLKALAKVPKRGRGVLSPRDISISGAVLSNVLNPVGNPAAVMVGGSMSQQKTLDSAVYVFEQNLYMFARQFGMESEALGAGVLDEFMVNILNKKGFDTSTMFGDFSSYLDEALSEGLINETQRESVAFGRFERRRPPGGRKGGRQKRQPLVRTFVDESNDRMSRIIQDSFRELFAEAGQGTRITGEMLKQKIEDQITQLGYDDEKITEIMKRYINDMFDMNTKAFDGFSVWSRSFYGDIERSISSEISKLEADIKSGRLGASEKAAAQERLRVLKNEKTAIGYALEVNSEQHTIRAGVTYNGRTYQVKSSTIAGDLDQALVDQGYVAFVSEADLKGELSLTGDVPGLNISGLGRSSGKVFLDEVTSGFLGSYLESPQSEQFIMERFADLQGQIQRFDETGMLDPQLIDALKHEASKEIDLLPAYARDSARRNKEYAARLLDMYRSGIDLRSAPQLVNFVHNYMQTNAFRMKDGQFQIALPGSYRFSTLSESSSELAGAGEDLLFGGESRIPSRRRIELANGQSAEVVNFRLKGHGILFAHQDVQSFYHVLGGFDLDDKALLHYTSYERSNGMKSFGFLVSRQPSGIEEVMFGTTILDAHAANSIFGSRKDIMNQVLDMMNLQGQDRLDRLSSLSGQNYTQTEADQIFSAIEDLFLLRRDNVTGAVTESRNILEMLGKTSGGTFNRIASNRGVMSQELNSAGTVSDHIENILTRLYGGPTLNQKTMDLIGRGGSTLAVSALNRSDPEFASFFVQRELFNAGAGDMTNPLLESLSRFSDDTEVSRIHSDLLSFVDRQKAAGVKDDEIFVELQKRLNTSYEGASDSARTMVEIALDDAFKMQTLLDAEQSGEILGQYVNRTMMVGNALGQVEGLVETVRGSSELTNFLGDERFRILYAGQEEAIDAAVLMGRIAKAMGESADQAATARGGIEAMNKLWGDAGFIPGEIVEGLGSDDRGELAIRQMGRLVGAISGISEDRIGFDAGLLMKAVDGGKSRLSDQDMRILMDEMLIGARTFVEQFESSSDNFLLESVERARTVISDLEEITSLSSSEENFNVAQRQREMLIERFGLKEGEYATTYLARRRAESMARQIGSARSLISDPSLNYVSADAKTERIAQQIVEDHKKLLDRARDAVGGVAEEQIDAISREASKLGIAESLYHSIAYAVDQHGVNLVDLANELDRAGFAEGLDILDIATVMTDDQDRISVLMKKMGDIRKLRQLELAKRSADYSVLKEMIGRAVQYESLGSLRYRVGSANPSVNERFLDPLSQRQALAEVAQKYSSDDDIQNFARRMLDDYDAYRNTGGTLGRLRGDNSRAAQGIVQKGRARLIKKLLNRYGEEAFEQLRAYIDDPNSTAENRAVANAYRASRALKEFSPDTDFPQEVAADPDAGAPSMTRGARRRMDDAAQGVTPASAISSNYKKFKKKLNDGDFQDLFKNKLIRKTAIGIGALVAGSFLYESVRDRTSEDMQGPPLLPGGSAYEDYPMRSPSIPNVDMVSSNSSMSYNISVNGNQQKIREFNERAAALTNGNTSTTIYNNLPRSRRDPYSEMGQRY